MSLLVVGINHRSSPLSLLERVTVVPDRLGKAVAGLAMRDNIREAVVLSTCNRTEVYVVTELFHGAYGDVRDFLCELGDLSADELIPHLYSQHDATAVAHLFEVAAGLDSAVLGESEILGQVRTAWEIAQFEGAARSTLNLLFRSAIEAGKRARTETGIARGTASVSHAAVEMITDVIGDLQGKRVLVVGAGAMGEGVAIALHRAGGADLLVSNRSAERPPPSPNGSVPSPSPSNGSSRRSERPTWSLPAPAPNSTSSRCELVQAARSGPRSARPLHIIDIAVPRDVEAGVGDLAGVTVLDLDDLRDWADRGLSHRAGEAERARAIVWEEVERFGVESTARQAAPLVASMRAAAEGIRRHELERFDNAFAGLDESQRDAVEALTKSIIAKLLHEPSVRLKAQAGTPQGERNAVTMRELFDLG